MTVALAHLLLWKFLPSKTIGIFVIVICIIVAAMNIAYEIKDRISQ